MATLYDLTGDFLNLLDVLLDPDTDPQLVQDSMESLQCEIDQKLDGCAVVLKELSSNTEKIDKEIKRLQRWKNTGKQSKKFERQHAAKYGGNEEKEDCYRFESIHCQKRTT